MREILFRGKRLDNGEWVEGFYVALKLVHYDRIERLITDKNTGESYDIDTATVGQYTGLKDKNGKRIFEGDIVVDGNDIYVCFWDGYNVEFGVKNKDSSFGIAYLPIAECEVIGNIHDNSELLEEARGE